MDTAIELFLSERDAVSAHVLASAATEVLRGLAKHNGIESFDAQLEKILVPGKEQDWRAAVNRHYNFFKHADRDADIGDIDFDPDITGYELLAGLQDYQSLFKIITTPMAIFRGYWVKTNPQIFVAEYRTLVEKGLEPFEIAGKTVRQAAAHYVELYQQAKKRGAKLPEGVEHY